MMQPIRTSTSIALILGLLAAPACNFGVKYCLGDCPQASDGAMTTDESNTDTGTGSTEATTTATTTTADTSPTGTSEAATTTGGPPPATCEVVDTIETPATCMDGVQQPGELCFLIGTGSAIYPQGVVSTLALPLTGEALGGIAVSRGDGGLEGLLFAEGPGLSPIEWPSVPEGAVVFTGSGDFNEDGIVDIAALIHAPKNLVRVFFLDDQGKITGDTTLSPAAEVLGLHVTDWDQDGHLDMIVLAAEPGIKDILVLRGLGTGDFTVNPYLDLGGIHHPNDLGDFDGDGRENELVFAVHEDAGTTLAALIGIQLIPAATFGPTAGVFALEIADVNEDGRGDILALVEDVANHTTSLAVGLQITDPVSQELAFPLTHYPVHCGAMTMAVGDVDADGHLDVVTAGLGAPSVTTIRVGDGAGGFPGIKTLPLGEQVGAIHIADLDGDGAADLVVKSGGAEAAVTYAPSTP